MAKIIGKKLKETRLKNNFSQEDLAYITSKHRETLSRLENSNSEALLKDLVMLSAGLGNPVQFTEMSQSELDDWLDTAIHIAEAAKDELGEEIFKKELNLT